MTNLYSKAIMTQPLRQNDDFLSESYFMDGLYIISGYVLHMGFFIAYRGFYTCYQ